MTIGTRLDLCRALEDAAIVYTSSRPRQYTYARAILSLTYILYAPPSSPLEKGFGVIATIFRILPDIMLEKIKLSSRRISVSQIRFERQTFARSSPANKWHHLRPNAPPPLRLACAVSPFRFKRLEKKCNTDHALFSLPTSSRGISRVGVAVYGARK